MLTLHEHMIVTKSAEYVLAGLALLVIAGFWMLLDRHSRTRDFRNGDTRHV